ncbi:MAG: hypothetical protein ACLFNY_06805, partial [Candidatus Aenigmatarchaeota archaeon]
RKYIYGYEGGIAVKLYEGEKIEDASRLVESGLDWSIVLKETEEQSDHTERKWFPLLYQSIEELEQGYSQQYPVKDEIYQRAMNDLEDIK